MAETTHKLTAAVSLNHEADQRRLERRADRDHYHYHYGGDDC